MVTRHFGKNFTFNGVTYGKFLSSTQDAAMAEAILGQGYIEFSTEAPSAAHRWLYDAGLPAGGKWDTSLVAARHYLLNGKYSHSSECAPDDVPAGYVECPTTPPDKDSELYTTTDGGKTWTLDLTIYKQRADASVKAEALKRADASFKPRADFETAYNNAATTIQAATDKAGVDAAVAGIVWPT